MWKEFHLWARKASFIPSSLVLDVIGLSRVSQWYRPHDVVYMVVDLCLVLNPCVGQVSDSEVVFFTNHEGIRGRFVVGSMYWERVAWERVILSEFFPNSTTNKIWMVVEEHTLTWEIIRIFNPFLKNLQWELCKSPSHFRCHMWKLEAPKP